MAPQSFKDLAASIASAPHSGYLAHPDFIEELRHELTVHNAKPIYECAQLFIAPTCAVDPVWAQSTWPEISAHSFSSIGEAAKILKTTARHWYGYHQQGHRRAQLIQQSLLRYPIHPLHFGEPLTVHPMGGWQLVDNQLLVCSAKTFPPYPMGEIPFVENKSDPPSRAYLKLWEAMARFNAWPRPGETVLDLGSSPGGWTWVLHGSGAHVISVDKAPLDSRLYGLDRVQIIKKDAFTLEPKDYPQVNWCLSDIICEPARAKNLIDKWVVESYATTFLFTIKFKGISQTEIVYQLLDQHPGSQASHLSHNKHEVTWYYEKNNS
jgi:23S rRNA (cytidine2498-2'-O)-methyltransferase